MTVKVNFVSEEMEFARHSRALEAKLRVEHVYCAQCGRHMTAVSFMARLRYDKKTGDPTNATQWYWACPAYVAPEGQPYGVDSDEHDCEILGQR